MGFYSAQLNEDDVVVAIVDSAERLEGSKIIEIDGLNTTIAGKKYNRETLAFDEVPKTEEELAEEQIQEEIKRIKAENDSMIREEAIANLQTSGKITVTEGVAKSVVNS